MAHIQCAKVIPSTKFKVYDYMTSPVNLAEQLKGHIEAKWQNPGAALAPNSEFLFLMSRFGIEQPIRFVVDRLVTGNSLTYRQSQGLYESFTHTMKFEEHGQGDTLVTDIVEYETPFGIFGKLADDFFIRSDLKRILEDRLEFVRKLFAAHNEVNDITQNKIENENIKETTWN